MHFPFELKNKQFSPPHFEQHSITSQIIQHLDLYLN